MRCVPIFTRILKENEESTLVQAWILLEKGGTSIMSVDTAEEALLFAKENELHLTGSKEDGDTIFLIVDRVNTRLNEFYSWGEANTTGATMDLWRPFVWYIPKNPENNLYINLCHMDTPFGEVLNTYFSPLAIQPSGHSAF